MNHTICAIEHCGLETSDGVEKLRLEGWYLSGVARESMAFILGGPDGATYQISDANRASDDVFRHHGDAFGDAAMHARFLLELNGLADAVDLQDAMIRTIFIDGTVITHVVFPPALALLGSASTKTVAGESSQNQEEEPGR